MEHLQTETGTAAFGASPSQRNKWRRHEMVDPTLLQQDYEIIPNSEPQTDIGQLSRYTINLLAAHGVYVKREFEA